jgi:lysozyme
MINDAESLIRAEEGVSNPVELDTLGFPTGGVGHKDSTLVVGTVLSEEQISAWFASDFISHSDGIKARWPAYYTLDPVRQAYVVSMAFQLGVSGVLGFPHTLGCLSAGDWQGAHDGVLASLWHQQTPNRCERCAMALLTGEYQQIP